MGSKCKRSIFFSKETMSVPWDILILELKEQKPCSFLPLSGSSVPAHCDTKLLGYMHLSTLACLLVSFIPLIILRVFPRDDVSWWRDADSNLPWYKRGENEELFPKSWSGTDKRIEWVLTVQVIHVFEQLSWNARGLCYDGVVTTGFL